MLSFPKIFLAVMLGLLYVAAESNADQEEHGNPFSLHSIRSHIENAFMAFSSIGRVSSIVTPDFLTMLFKAMECGQRQLKNADLCNFNFSFNPFRIAKECSQSTGFTELVESIQKAMPSITVPIGVPAFKSQSRCFDPKNFLRQDIKSGRHK